MKGEVLYTVLCMMVMGIAYQWYTLYKFRKKKMVPDSRCPGRLLIMVIYFATVLAIIIKDKDSGMGLYISVAGYVLFFLENLYEFILKGDEKPYVRMRIFLEDKGFMPKRRDESTDGEK